jgi:hypothetical protein
MPAQQTSPSSVTQSADVVQVLGHLPGSIQIPVTPRLLSSAAIEVQQTSPASGSHSAVVAQDLGHAPDGMQMGEV